MVEFGLKLEDNKVDSWSDQYIDYEKLKAVLKKAKAAAAKRDELMERMPPGAVEEVLRDRKKDRGAASSSSSSHRAPMADGGGAGVELMPPSVIATPSRKTEEEGGDGDATATASATATKPPLSTTTVVYPVRGGGDTTSAETMAATDSTPLLGGDRSGGMKRGNSWGSHASWGSNMKGAIVGVASFVGLADNRAQLRQACAEADDKMDLFKRTYEQEVAKVKAFCKEQTDEISQLMEVLVESVDESGLEISRKKMPKRSSLVENMTQKFEGMMRSVRSSDGGPGNSAASYPDVDFQQSESLEEQYDDEEIRTESKMWEKDEIMRKSDSIKRAITDIYRTTKLLHNYSIMNYTGFVKIAKKFDKTFPEHKGLFKNSNCDDGKEAEILAAKLERMFAKWFCGQGGVREAQAQMLPKKGDGLLMDWTQLRLGYRLGMCSILAMWVAWDCVWGQFAMGQVSIGGRSAFPVFRACFGLLFWHWCWGVSVYVWTRHRINYIYLFEFDPRNVDTPLDIFNDAVDETLVFLICMLMYYKADAGDMPLWIPPRAYPFILIVYTVKCLLFPWKQRLPMWIAIKEVITAPLVSPSFFLTYVGDVFTSMVKVFQDILWTICFVASGDFLLSEVDHDTKGSHVHAWTGQFWYKNIAIPLICLMPLWIRFMQCLRKYFDTGNRMPHLANAFKYALSQSVTLFGAFHPLYLMHTENEVHIVSMADDDDIDHEGAIVIGNYRSSLFQVFWLGLFVSSSLYSFWWDVYMDWGLGQRKYGFLGPRLMFPKKSTYYSVMAVDLVLRSMWVLTLLPPDSGATFELPAYLSAISMGAELFRRTIWSFFRLENQHRQNTEGFRRVTVVPLHFNTGHKHKYQERHWVGWKVLVEIAVVTAVVVGISAASVIVAQKAAHPVQMPNPTDFAEDL